MKTIYIILVISIIGNVILILDEFCVIDFIKIECHDGGEVIYGSGACNNKDRYLKPGLDGGGEEIGNDQARVLTEGWMNRYGNANPGIIQCGMISKIAIDSLFSYNLTDNVLSIEMGFDETAGNATMLITSKNDDRYKIITNSTGEKNYKVLTVCPTQCDIMPLR